MPTFINLTIKLNMNIFEGSINWKSSSLSEITDNI